MGAIEGIRLERVSQGEILRWLEARSVFAALVDESAQCWGLRPGDPEDRYDLGRLLRVLEEVVGAYEGSTQIERIKLADPADIPEVIQSVDHQLVLFPIFSKAELVQLARRGAYLPTGITRHVIPGRALGLDLSLEFLTALDSDEAKQSHFHGVLDRIQLGGRVRFYQESVFILNE
jgi:hypothetical protein